MSVVPPTIPTATEPYKWWVFALVGTIGAVVCGLVIGGMVIANLRGNDDSTRSPAYTQTMTVIEPAWASFSASEQQDQCDGWNSGREGMLATFRTDGRYDVSAVEDFYDSVCP